MLKATSFPFTLVGPGQTAVGSVGFTSPADASYKAEITADNHSIFKVSKIWAFRPTLEWADNGPDPGDGVHKPPHRPVKVIVDELVGTSDGITPLNVLQGDMLTIYVQMVCPRNPDDTYFATLTITSSNAADTTDVRLSVPTGYVDVQVLNNNASTAPGSDATWKLRLQSLAGPGANISFAAGLQDSVGAISIPPVTTFLPRRGLLIMSLNATVGDTTPPGSYTFYLTETVFNGADTFSPAALSLTVTDPPVLVTGPEPILVMYPGDQIEFPLDVQLKGATTGVDLSIDPTVPGLTCTFVDGGGNNLAAPVHLDIPGKGHDQVSLRVTAAQDTPMNPTAFAVSWSAYNDSEQGKITFGVTIVPPQIRLHAEIVTGGLSGLGGFVDLTFAADGTYTVHWHMWNTSKLTGYDYQVRAIFTAANGMILVMQHSGHVDAEDVFGSAAEDDYVENGKHLWVQANWGEVVNGSMAVSHEYSASGGILGELESLAQDAVIIWSGGLAAGTTGAAFGMMISLTRETDRVFGGVAGAFAVVGGVVVFSVEIAIGANTVTALMCATVAGFALGAVTDAALISARQVHEEEYDFANSAGVGGSNYSNDPENASVFMGILPPIENLWITNLCNPDRGRAFTVRLQGITYMNMGAAYDHIIDPNGQPKAYPAQGQLFIHELTHALQIDRRNYAAVICSGIVNGVSYIFGNDVYQFGPAGPDWHSSYFNLESQAHVVDAWLAGRDTNNYPTGQPMDRNSPYFMYIRDNIRTGDV